MASVGEGARGGGEGPAGPAPHKGRHWEARGLSRGLTCAAEGGDCRGSQKQEVGQGAGETKAGPAGIGGCEEAGDLATDEAQGLSEWD